MRDLRELAHQVAKGDESASEAFNEALRNSTDVDVLKAIAAELTTCYEVAFALYQRALEIDPDDASARSQLGFLHWLFGEDGLARSELEAARTKAPEGVDVLLLEAALESSPSRRERIYRRILEIDPDNKIAAQNLKITER